MDVDRSVIERRWRVEKEKMITVYGEWLNTTKTEMQISKNIEEASSEAK